MFAITTADVERLAAVLRQRITDCQNSPATTALAAIYQRQLDELLAADDNGRGGHGVGPLGWHAIVRRIACSPLATSASGSASPARPSTRGAGPSRDGSAR